MEKIKVLVRIRPFLQNENSSSKGLNIDSKNLQKIGVSKSLKKFEATFDKVLPQDCNQNDVFDFISPCIDQIKQGLNCTILAYGQTGSGKTYTMFGEEWAKSDKNFDIEQRKYIHKDDYNFILNEDLFIDPFSKTNGIIPNLIMSLFKTFDNYDSNDNNITITCSYIQIYNEKVYDLLAEEEETEEKKKDFVLLSGKYNNEKPINQKPLRIKYDKNNGVIIEGVNEIRTPNFYDIFELLRQGEINRKIRQTKRNEMSSRSHTIFIINIQNEKLNTVSKIKLCDLAGSERYDSRESYKKLHFNEMVNINKSLLVLGNVIHSLAGRNSNLSSTLNKNKNKMQKKVFAPYKDSKLTQILEDSLGGNSVTYLIANISPNEENFDETISTLKFADRAHSIMTKVSMNKLNSKGEGYNSKEFEKICDELFQLKQLFNIRRKRGTLEPIQEEFFKLKDENTLLRKNLGGENNLMRIKELIKENNNLRKEIKTLSEQNKSLKKEMKGKSFINITEDSYNISNTNKNNYSGKKSPNNRYTTNNNYNENNKTNNKISRNKNANNGNNNLEYNKYLNTVDDMINYNEMSNQNSFNKSKNKSTKKSKNNILKESGQNIVYGMNNKYEKTNKNKNNNKLNDENNLYKDINNNNYDSNYDFKENDSNLDKNNKNTTSKMSKLNNITSSYERLEKLNQLEEENKKETQELLENMENSLNSKEEDI